MSLDYGQKGNYVRPNNLILKKAHASWVLYVDGEGGDAYVRLRTWDWIAMAPGPPTGKVLLRGDVVWKGLSFESEGVDYVYVSSPRRKTAGWVPLDSTSDVHPLVLLARRLAGKREDKAGSAKALDTRFDEKSCTNGAFKIQNWLRGYVADDGRDRRKGGALARLKDKVAWADALRRYALEGKYVQYYLKKDKTRITDPNDPHLWLWPGDLATFSRSRYWDSKKKRLELVPYGKAIAHPGVFHRGYDGPAMTYGWSGHVKTLIHTQYDEGTKRYTRIGTLEGHMGGLAGEETEAAVYTIEDFLFRGVNRWGMVPIRASGRSRASLQKAAHEAWDGEYWWYHKRMAEEPAERRADDTRTSAEHEAESRRLLAQAAQRRGLPTPDWDTTDDLGTSDSGLECFGFAYWKD